MSLLQRAKTARQRQKAKNWMAATENGNLVDELIKALEREENRMVYATNPAMHRDEFSPHCWHRNGGERVYEDIFREHTETCCWCGEERTLRYGFNRGLREHGPVKVKEHVIFPTPFYIYGMGVDEHCCTGVVLGTAMEEGKKDG